MSGLTNEALPSVDQPDMVHGVREVLDRASFDEPHIPGRCGVREMAGLSFGAPDRPRLLWRTRDDSPRIPCGGELPLTGSEMRDFFCYDLLKNSGN
ncbi:MAG: hypothetical protein WBX00_00385 [Isosphaeraceae bacterium]